MAGIHIPSYRNHRRNAADSGDDLRPTDIAGVDDMSHAGQALLGLTIDRRPPRVNSNRACGLAEMWKPSSDAGGRAYPK
jgi:hypothetical protein